MEGTSPDVPVPDGRNARRNIGSNLELARANGRSLERFVASLDVTEIETLLRDWTEFFPEGMSGDWQHALLTRWTELQPNSAAKYARGLNTAGMVTVLETWTRLDIAAACAWMREFGDPAFSAAVFEDGAHATLSEVLALILFEKLPAHANLHVGVEILGRATHEDVRRWLSDAPPSPLRHRALVQFSQLNPERARDTVLEALGNLPDGPERTQLLNVILGSWSRTDPIATAAWLDQAPDSASKTAAWASLTARWAEAHPVQAARIAAELPPGPVQHQAVISAVSGWARIDPSAAAAWVMRFPESTLRGEAMEQLVFAWATRDAAAASDWLSRVPLGPSRDAAIDAFRALVARGSVANAADLQ